MKHILVFIAAASLSLVAAWYTFGDSAHAMGMISTRGGRAHHPVRLPSGNQRYTLVVTASVLPPFQGDARVTVEGLPELNYSVHATQPIVDLGLRHHPKFKDQTYVGLRPRDRLSMWVVLHIPEFDPVCGHRREDSFISGEFGGDTVWFCSSSCREEYEHEPSQFSADRYPNGTYHVTFTDVATDATVLRIPVVFGGGAQEGHRHEG